MLEDKELIDVPTVTVLGSLINYICSASDKHFRPMNSNYGVLTTKSKDKMELKELSLNSLKEWMKIQPWVLRDYVIDQNKLNNSYHLFTNTIDLNSRIQYLL